MPNFLETADYSKVPTSQLDQLLKAIQQQQGSKQEVNAQAPQSVEPGYDPGTIRAYEPTWRDSVQRSPVAQGAIGALRGFLEPAGVVVKPDLGVDFHNPFNDNRPVTEMTGQGINPDAPRLDSADPAVRAQAVPYGIGQVAGMPLLAGTKAISAVGKAPQAATGIVKVLRELYGLETAAEPIIDRAGNAVRWGTKAGDNLKALSKTEQQLASKKGALDAVTGATGAIQTTGKASRALVGSVTAPVRAAVNYAKNPIKGKAKVSGLEYLGDRLTQPTDRDRAQLDTAGNSEPNLANDVSSSSETKPSSQPKPQSEAGAIATTRDRLAAQVQEAIKNDRQLKPYESGKRGFWERLDRSMNPITARKNDQQLELENTRQQLLRETPSPAVQAQIKDLDRQLEALTSDESNAKQSTRQLRGQMAHSYAPAMTDDALSQIEQQTGIKFDRTRLSQMGKTDPNAGLMQLLAGMGLAGMPATGVQPGNPQIKLNPPKNRQ